MATTIPYHYPTWMPFLQNPSAPSEIARLLRPKCAVVGGPWAFPNCTGGPWWPLACGISGLLRHAVVLFQATTTCGISGLLSHLHRPNGKKTWCGWSTGNLGDTPPAVNQALSPLGFITQEVESSKLKLQKLSHEAHEAGSTRLENRGRGSLLANYRQCHLAWPFRWSSPGAAAGKHSGIFHGGHFSLWCRHRPMPCVDRGGPGLGFTCCRIIMRHMWS